jgi:hypothetical protein
MTDVGSPCSFSRLGEADGHQRGKITMMGGATRKYRGVSPADCIGSPSVRGGQEYPAYPSCPGGRRRGQPRGCCGWVRYVNSCVALAERSPNTEWLLLAATHGVRDPAVLTASTSVASPRARPLRSYPCRFPGEEPVRNLTAVGSARGSGWGWPSLWRSPWGCP